MKKFFKLCHVLPLFDFCGYVVGFYGGSGLYLDPALIVEIKKASAKKFKRGDQNFKKAPLNQKFDLDIKKLLGLKIDTKIFIKVAYIKKNAP